MYYNKRQQIMTQQTLFIYCWLSVIAAIIAATSDVLRCCDFVAGAGNSNDLQSCTQGVLVRRESDFITRNVPYTIGAQGPTMVVTLLTRSTDDIKDYAAYSHFLQAVYAQHNNYLLLSNMRQSDSPTDDYQYFRKLVPIMEALNSTGSIDSDYVVWMDADLIPIDLNLRIERLAAEHPEAHIIMSADVSSIANSGCIIVRNTPQARIILAEWWALRNDSRASTDQLGFEVLYKSRPDIHRRIALLSPDALNSEAPPMGRQLDHHKVLHLAAESNDLRRTVFQMAAKGVCEQNDQRHQNTPSKITFSHQLGVSRRVLQKAAQEVYMASTATLMKRFSPSLYAMDVETLSAYRQAFSKFSHATRYAMKEEKETVLTKHVRGLSLFAVCLLLEADLNIVSYYDYSTSSKLERDADGQYNRILRFHKSTLQHRIVKELHQLENQTLSFVCSRGIRDCRSSPQQSPCSADTKELARICQSRVQEVTVGALLTANTGQQSDGLLVSPSEAATFHQLVMQLINTKAELMATKNRFSNHYSRDGANEYLKRYCNIRGEANRNDISCMNRRVNEISSDMPELLKIVAEIAFESMQSLESTVASASPFELNKAVGNYTLSALHLLKQLVATHQHHLVLDMQSGLLTQLGQMSLYLDPPRPKEALEFLQSSVALSEESLATGAGTDRRSYVYTLTLVAQSYCLSKDYDRGLVTFERAIRLEIEHVGAYHHNLINKYTNAGICALEGGKTAKAKSWLEAARTILKSHKSLELSADIEARIATALASIR